MVALLHLRGLWVLHQHDFSYLQSVNLPMCFLFPMVSILVWFIYTYVATLISGVSLLSWLCIHQRDFIPAQRDIPSLNCVSHYLLPDCVPLVSMYYDCAANLIEESEVYFLLPELSLSRYTICLPKLTCSLMLLSPAHYLFIFLYMAFGETSQ